VGCCDSEERLGLGVHGCSPYCDLDERFHEVLKYQLPDTSCYWSNDRLKTELLKQRQVLDELIGVLVANPEVDAEAVVV
jgi:hypothetical protein